MTSFREPDYDIALEISLSNFRKISGTAFSVIVRFSDNKADSEGMLIIPEGSGFPEESAAVEAWLWADSHEKRPLDTRVDITIGEPCDPLFFDRFEELTSHQGMHLTGMITHVRGTRVQAT